MKDVKIPIKQENQEITKQAKTQNIVQSTMQQSVEIKQVSPFVSLLNTKVEEKPQKIKSDETLASLLRGNSESKKESGLTADFSVATAKVIAPKNPVEIITSMDKVLEPLTSVEQKETTNVSKLDGLSTSKVDELEAKINEAKQMVKYLSQDVKTAIEDYKSPFTRIKLQLNPQKLGEVEITMIKRGKNLHVNIGSNSNAINTLALNVNELRLQLNNSGINNATLNFNNTQSSDSNSSTGQQNSGQNQKQAHREYNYLEKEETQEEILSSLEIVIPSYA